MGATFTIGGYSPSPEDIPLELILVLPSGDAVFTAAVSGRCQVDGLHLRWWLLWILDFLRLGLFETSLDHFVWNNDIRDLARLDINLFKVLPSSA